MVNLDSIVLIQDYATIHYYNKNDNCFNSII